MAYRPPYRIGDGMSPSLWIMTQLVLVLLSRRLTVSSRSAAVGDLNGDGFGDVCIGAAGDITTAGRVSCFFGQASFSSVNVTFSDLDGVNGFLITGKFSYSGHLSAAVN